MYSFWQIVGISSVVSLIVAIIIAMISLSDFEEEDSKASISPNAYENRPSPFSDHLKELKEKGLIGKEIFEEKEKK